MANDLSKIKGRILDLGCAMLAQANTHSALEDPGIRGLEYVSILSAVHACELFMKAAIAKRNPLSMFKNKTDLELAHKNNIKIDDLLKRGKTYEISKLPAILKNEYGIAIHDVNCFDESIRLRNNIQHFISPNMHGYQIMELSLKFIYKIIDPLIFHEFGIYCIEHHNDISAGYDYIVGAIISRELKFSIPPNFEVTEIDIDDKIRNTSKEYQEWFNSQLAARISNQSGT